MKVADPTYERDSYADLLDKTIQIDWENGAPQYIGKITLIDFEEGTIDTRDSRGGGNRWGIGRNALNQLVSNGIWNSPSEMGVQIKIIDTIAEYKINNPGSDFNLEDAFNKSPQYHSYNDVLELIKSYDDEDILFDFKDVFPENGIISKEGYISFVLDYIDDLSEAGMNKANWISISDPDIFIKAKLI
jgi:hypothetical protein